MLNEQAPQSAARGWWGRMWLWSASRVWVSALVVALVGVFMDVLTAGTPVSGMFRHLAARMYAPFDGYFYSRGEAAQAVSRRLLVVDLGQSTLARLRATWPLSYGQHARLLERIRQGQPRAVFVDFQFQARRDDPSLAQLQSVLCAFKADGIPVFLASGSDADEGQLRPELEQLRDAQGRPCFSKVAVGYAPDDADRIAWRYPLQSEVGGQTLPSAALAIAQAMRGHSIDVEAHEKTDMGLVWGSGEDVQGPAWQRPSEPEHAAVPGGAQEPVRSGGAEERYCRPLRWSDQLPLQGFVAGLFGLRLDHRPACPMHQSIEAASLTAPKTAEQDRAQQALLRGRAVFYGGSFDANDFVGSPLHGDLPGVYLHAQATDNLLHFGDEWLHPELGGRWGEFAEPLVLGGSFFLIALGLALGRCLMAWVGRRMPRFKRRRPLTPRQTKPVCAPSAGMLGWRVFRHRLGQELGGTLSRLAQFYLLLLLAIPLSWLLEGSVRVSVIGYGSVLAFCLLGELLAASHETEKAYEHLAPEAASSSRPDTTKE